MMFKICSQFLEIAIFEKIAKLPLKNSTFLVFFNAHIKLVENLVNETKVLEKCVFTLPNNHFKF